MKWFAMGMLAVASMACGHRANQTAKITRFEAQPNLIPSGMVGQLCYGVVNASKLDLAPPVEVLLPEEARCFEIRPKIDTSYTLTAVGEDGTKATKTVLVKVGPAAPKVADLTATPKQVKRGQQVRVCFQATGFKSIKVHPGKLSPGNTCLTDRPKKTTTYTVTALGANREEDSGTIIVPVLK